MMFIFSTFVCGCDSKVHDLKNRCSSKLCWRFNTSL